MGEPLEETPQGSAETSQPQEPVQSPRKHPRLSIIAGVSGMTVLVVLFALLFAAINHRSAASGGSLPPPAGWQRYTDPGGYFTVTIPKGWTVQRETSTSMAGDSHGSVTFPDVMDTFGGPPRGQNTITVWIYVEAITSERARQWMCEARSPSQNNTTLAGLPAWHDEVFGWIVNSSGASFQISYVYPNYPGNVAMPVDAPTATPMPPGFYEQGQQDLHAILASFMPTPDTPLKCP